MRNLAVGHFYNEPFIRACTPWRERIAEVFFAWPGVLSCRPAPAFNPEVRERLFSDLRWARKEGILLDTLFNCNCYGDIAISCELSDFVRSVLAEMEGEGLFPDIVTTTSPFIATVLRREFPSLEIRGSVNMRIHGTLGFEYVDNLFDSFYVSREYQRDFAYLEACRKWALKAGKKIGMQLNSGCLRQCPYQQFHDNLHGHNRIGQSKRGDALAFTPFLCKSVYAQKKFSEFIRATWVRPEDTPLFEPYVSVMKLATRRVSNPTEILNAYASYSFDGNLLRLMDPNHAEFFQPYEIDNKRFPDDWARSGIGSVCGNNCTHCGQCEAVLERVMKVTG